MLQGTLDVFSLDEVLGLLSGANKNGVLNITGDRGVGTVSIADGALVGGSASSAPESTELSDVVFELLRYEEGSFSFDGAAEVDGEPHELTAVMTEAHARLDEWQSIEAVVPSLDHHVTLTAELTTSQVTLSESEWAAIIAVGEGASVGTVARRLDLGEFDGSKRVKALIERSLASLDDVAPVAEAAPTTAPVEVEEAPAFTAPVFETPEPAPASFANISTEAPVAIDETLTEDIAADVSIDTVAPDAPAFEDTTFAPVEVDAEIPPMPEAPSFASFSDTDAADTDIPPMPEPPAAFETAVDDVVPPAPDAPFSSDVFDAPMPAVDATPSTFGGLDPIAGADIFEAPRRGGERATDTPLDSFDTDGMTMDAPMPPPPASVDAMAPLASNDDAVPSFAPPAAFDPDAFAAADDAATSGDDIAEAASEEAAGQEKGGSLLMRYLKSNG